MFDLLTVGRKDASGDSTRGVGLSPGQAMAVLYVATAFRDDEESRAIRTVWESAA